MSECCSVRFRRTVFCLLLGFSAASAAAGEVVYKNFLGMEFVRIPAGTFQMGSPETELGRDVDEIQHQVTLSKDFLMQTTEVTRKQWKDLLVGDPSSHEDCGDNCAVDSVEWDWVELFIEKLNVRDAAYQYRLPTEAEWEYSARAGSATPFHAGTCLDDSKAAIRADQAYGMCRVGGVLLAPVPTRRFAPNAWGLYDMHGGAWELCSDWYGEYPKAAVTDPKGPAAGEFRVKRGGSWFTGREHVRSARRSKVINSISGFRLIAEPKTSSQLQPEG